VGGTAGGIEAGADRFLAGSERLSEAARGRLVLENDDRAFGIGDVVPLAERAGLRVVWDPHHHHCHDPHRLSESEALAAALATWPDGVTPKIHYSSPRLDVDLATRRLPQLRAHADLVDPIGFERFIRDVSAAGRDFDVMLEAKAKDLALIRLRDQLAARGMPWDDGRVVVS
jgi:UV DNA damage endonuclease